MRAGRAARHFHGLSPLLDGCLFNCSPPENAHSDLSLTAQSVVAGP